MNRRIHKLTTLAFALLLSIALQAQTQRITATIPFDFQVGKQHMPAGKYIVGTTDGYLFTITATDRSDIARVLTNSIGSKHPGQEGSRLVFRSIGDQHYLVQVWSPELQDGRSIALPKNSPASPNGGGGEETTVEAER